MEKLTWIFGAGMAMTLISLVGVISLLLAERVRQQILLPLVAFAAGALVGGAIFSLLPAAVAETGNTTATYAWVAVGFTGFFAVEQLLRWHHHHHRHEHPLHVHHHHPPPGERRPAGYLILFADGIHNFIDGLAVAATFLIDIRLGLTTVVIAAAHEIPQELGDFAVLLHSGWQPRQALLFNFLSSLTFFVGEAVAVAAWQVAPLHFLVPLAAGNFLYVGAAGLVPELNQEAPLGQRVGLFLAFVAGMLLIVAFDQAMPHGH